MVLGPPPRFALAKGLEHLVDVLLRPAGPAQHLARDVLHVLHGHVVFITRRVVDVREAAVIYHCVVRLVNGCEGRGGSLSMLRCGSLVSGLQRSGPLCKRGRSHWLSNRREKKES